MGKNLSVANEIYTLWLAVRRMHMEGSQIRALMVIVPVLLTGCASPMAARDALVPTPEPVAAPAPESKPVVVTAVEPEVMYCAGGRGRHAARPI